MYFRIYEVLLYRDTLQHVHDVRLELLEDPRTEEGKVTKVRVKPAYEVRMYWSTEVPVHLSGFVCKIK